MAAAPIGLVARRDGGSAAPRLIALAFAAALACLCFQDRAAHAQDQGQSVEITGDRLSGVVLPIEPIAADIQLQALRAWAWTVDDTKRLRLHGDVRINIGAYAFMSQDAAVWINRIPSAQGTINQLAVYFENVGDPTKEAGLGVKGKQLLVTASSRGEVKLSVALLDSAPPPHDALLRNGEQRLAEHLRGLLGNPPPLRGRPKLEKPAAEPEFVPVPGGTVREQDVKPAVRLELPPTQQPMPWLIGPRGVVRFSAQTIEIESSEQENTITAIGAIVVEVFSERQSDTLSQLTLTAERGVIFTNPGPLTALGDQLDAKQVRGVYLEGNVSASSHDGTIVVRAPFVYYDFRTQQAIMLNSLLRLQQRDSRVPVYARAQEMRQLAQNQWEAKKVTVSTSEFATPHLAIGAQQATITRRDPEGGGRATTFVDSRSNTLQAEGVPIFFWPRFQGDVEKVPLRSVEAGSRSNDGLRLLTTWDFFALAGKEAPPGVDAELHVDGFTKRGAALGTVLRYDVGDAEGKVDLYGLYDQGTDHTTSGQDVEPDKDFRGVALLEFQTNLSQYWSMQAQAALISDDTFITAWRDDDFNERREYETSLYLKHQHGNAALTLLGKYSLNDFLSNSYLLASRQYAVDKLPELTYRRYGDSLFNDHLTYSTEIRVTRMRMVFERATPRGIGVPGGAFGLGPDDDIADALMLRGLRESWVDRVDSRHELALPLHPGVFNVTPFIVGRFTGYDDGFSEFSSDADEMRFFGAGGVRVNTQFQRIHNAVESEFWDLHRLRHLVEPYVTLWSAYSSVNQDDLPIYDEEVESLADGSAVQVGVRNTWQTQRGGPGAWRSVDWLTLDTSVVFDSEGEPNESPTPQFFDYRPEYSQFGDHIKTQGIWLLSDSLSLAGEATYALQDSVLARSSIGAELRHSPLLTSYIEYRYIQIDRNELLGIGWTYQLTPKYRVSLSPQWDLREDKFRSVNVRVTRSFPDFDFTMRVRYDDIADDTQFGASMDLVKF